MFYVIVNKNNTKNENILSEKERKSELFYQLV